MVWQAFLPDLLRETRYLFSPNSCPWGAFGLVVVLCSTCACCCGFFLGGVVFSNQCRRIAAFAARAALTALTPHSGSVEVTLRDRLAEYHRSGWCKPRTLTSNRLCCEWLIWRFQWRSVWWSQASTQGTASTWKWGLRFGVSRLPHRLLDRRPFAKPLLKVSLSLRAWRSSALRQQQHRSVLLYHWISWALLRLGFVVVGGLTGRQRPGLAVLSGQAF